MPFTGFQDFDPKFGDALRQFLANNPGVSINSGYRTPEEQAVLYAKALKKYGNEREARRHVAPAGKSQHNKRQAADLGYKDDASRKAAHASAAKYGLVFPMGHEDWHIEPIGARNGNNNGTFFPAPGGDTAAGDTAPPPTVADTFDFSTIGSKAAEHLAGGENGNDPRITETRSSLGETPLLDVTPVSLTQATGETRVRSPQLSPSLTSLSDLFQTKTIGLAGSPSLPGRRF